VVKSDITHHNNSVNRELNRNCVKRFIELALKSVCCKSIKGGAAPDRDNIPSDIVKNCQALIIAILHLINLNNRTGEFPNVFKIFKLIPFYKAGKK
jgi:hypothetical protein